MDYGSHTVDVLTGDWGNTGSVESPLDTQGSTEPVELPPDAVPRPASSNPKESPPIHVDHGGETTNTQPAGVESATSEPEVAVEGLSLQEKFERESEALGL